MDLTHPRPSTAPHSGRPPSHGIVPGPDGRLPPATGASRYQRLRGKSVSSEQGHKPRQPQATLQSQTVYQTPPNYQAQDLNNTSNSPPKRLLRIGGWLRGHIQQSDTKALHSTPLDSSNSVSPIRTASHLTKLPHRDYPQPDRRGTGNDDPVTSRGHASIADEAVLLEAETERILATQESSIGLRSEVQRPRRGASIRHPRPIRKKISSLKGATKTNHPQHQVREITTEPNVHASANVVAAESYITPTLNTQHNIKPSVETQGRSYNQFVATVHFLDNVFHVLVTTETWPRDVASMAARVFPGRVKPAECVVVECCKEEGLKRCLRQYERLCDVMSTWGRDQDNSFILLPRSSRDLGQLKLASVLHLEGPPPGFAFQLYHSKQPGNWERSWVTLAESGLIFATNQPTPQPLGETSIALCHLSDCDIYTANSNTIALYQVPTRYCFVIKRQVSREATPAGGESVHVFSSDLQQLIERFYELVQRWRSWYLVRGTREHTATDKPSKLSSSPYSKHQAPRHLNPLPHEKDLINMASTSDILAQENLFEGIEHPSHPIRDPRVEAVPPRDNKLGPSTPAATTKPQKLSPSRLENINVSNGKQQHISPSNASQQGTTAHDNENAHLETPTKSPLLSNTSPTEKKEIQSWFPSAIEHSARKRQPRRRRSVYHQRAADKPSSVRQKIPPPARNPVESAGSRQVVRPPPVEQDFDPNASLAQRPPPYGRPPRQAGRGKSSYKKPPGGQTLNHSRPGQPIFDHMYVPPLPDRSPKRDGLGVRPLRAYGLRSPVE